MNRDELKEMTARLLAGELAHDEFLAGISVAIEAAKQINAQTTPAVTLDLDRQRRCGFPEVIFGEGKPAATIAAIIDKLLASGVRALATRISAEKAEQLLQHFAEKNSSARYNATARTFRVDPLLGTGGASGPRSETEQNGKVAIITAGTSDLPVAEEARETVEWMGVSAVMIHDVGVAGPHRLPLRLPEFEGSDVIICVAGMEAALPSIVGGYVPCPVIGVPTSVGYGANLGGIAALLSMLNSCAANVTVVNIDAGFKGGYLAGLIASRALRKEPRTQ